MAIFKAISRFVQQQGGTVSGPPTAGSKAPASQLVTAVVEDVVSAQISQALVEGALLQGAVDAQVSQALVEGALVQGAASAQVSHALVEIAVVGFVAGFAHSQVVIVG